MIFLDMLNAQETIDNFYNEMRWRILSLAADMDRLQRAAGGQELIGQDKRVASLRRCMEQLLSDDVGRAERVQMILSDMTPPPSK